MSDITALIQAQNQDGRTPDLKVVFDRLYPELKRLAGARLSVMSAGQTLTPTVLVHEAYDRLIQASNLDIQSRRHFFATAGKVMRYIIVDHLRASGASKRGGDLVAVTLTEAVARSADRSELLELDQALDELDRVNPVHRELVELHFFAGLPMSECAELLEISVRTAWREWQRARAFLHVRVSQPQD